MTVVTIPESSKVLAYIRHGEAELNLTYLYDDNPESPHHLTELGREQSECAGVQLGILMRRAGIDSPASFQTSGYYRSDETAVIIARHIGGQLSVSELLRERSLGKLNGKTSHDVSKSWKEEPKKYGVEEFEELKERTRRFANGLPQGFNIAVTHRDVIVAAMADVLGRKDEPQFLREHPTPNCSITLIDYTKRELLLSAVEFVEAPSAETREPNAFS